MAGSVGARLGARIDVSAVQSFKNNVEAVDVYLPIFMILVRNQLPAPPTAVHQPRTRRCCTCPATAALLTAN